MMLTSQLPYRCKGNHKLFHVDMLKRYFAKEEDQVKEISTSALEDVAMANPMFVINDIN